MIDAIKTIRKPQHQGTSKSTKFRLQNVRGENKITNEGIQNASDSWGVWTGRAH